MPTGVVFRRNLCPNPSFEVDTAGWATYGPATHERVNDWAGPGGGTWSLHISIPNPTGSTFDAPPPAGDSFVMATVPGQTYIVSMIGYSTGSQFYLAAGQTVGQRVSGDGSQTIAVVTFTAKAATQTISVGYIAGIIHSDVSKYAGAEIHIDNVIAEIGGSRRGYFDGSYAGATWDGTAGDSTSTIYATANLAAVPDDDNGRVLLSVAWQTIASCTITRTDPDGRTHPVRNANPLTLVAGAGQVFDYEAPVGARVQYTATESGGNTLVAVASVADLDDGSVWLKHPNNPGYNLRIPEAQVTPLADDVQPAQQSILRALDRPRGISLSLGRGAFQSTFQFWTDNADDYASVMGLLADGIPLLLQFPTATLRESAFIAVGDVPAKRLAIHDWSDPARLWTLPYEVVDPPVGVAAAAPDQTFRALLAKYPTFRDLANSGKTFRQIALNPGAD